MQTQGEPSWEEFAAEGDTPEACLGHKLSIKKRDSAAAIKELTLQHIKRLRALGWHLHLQCERCVCQPFTAPLVCEGKTLS